MLSMRRDGYDERPFGWLRCFYFVDLLPAGIRRYPDNAKAAAGLVHQHGTLKRRLDRCATRLIHRLLDGFAALVLLGDGAGIKVSGGLVGGL